jgi:hypothetical protein
MDAEAEIYIANKFRRRASAGLFVGLLGLFGLGIGVYALQTMPPRPPEIEVRSHESCPHPECKNPHPGRASSGFNAGTATGVLVGAYMALCAGLVVAVVRD